MPQLRPSWFAKIMVKLCLKAFWQNFEKVKYKIQFSGYKTLKNLLLHNCSTEFLDITPQMKTSSSKLPISTTPDNQYSLHNIKYCFKIYQNVWLEYFISFFKFIYNFTNNWYFYKNLHLRLSEVIVFVQMPLSPY